MPRRITQTEVINQLNRAYFIDKLGIDLRNYSQESIPISYENFEKAMRKDEFLTSDTTIKSKWKGLVADEVLILTSRDRAKVNVTSFRISLYRTTYTQHIHTEHTQTAHTHTEEAVQ